MLKALELQGIENLRNLGNLWMFNGFTKNPKILEALQLHGFEIHNNQSKNSLQSARLALYDLMGFCIENLKELPSELQAGLTPNLLMFQSRIN